MKNLLFPLSLLLFFSTQLLSQKDFVLSGGFQTQEIVSYDFPEDANEWPSSVQGAKLTVRSKNVSFESGDRSVRHWLKSLDIDQNRDFQVEVSFSTGLFKGEGGCGFIFGSNGQRHLYFGADHDANTSCGLSINGSSRNFERKEPITNYVGNFGIGYTFTLRKVDGVYYFFKNGNLFGEPQPQEKVGTLGSSFGFYSYQEFTIKPKYLKASYILGPPPLITIQNVQMSDQNGDNQISNGESIVLSIDIANSSKGKGFEIGVHLEGIEENMLKMEESPKVPILKGGEQNTLQMKLRGGIHIQGTDLNFNLIITEENQRRLTAKPVIFQSRKIIPPSIVIQKVAFEELEDGIDLPSLSQKELIVTVQNPGELPLKNLRVLLDSDIPPKVINLPTTQKNIGTIPAGEEGTVTFRFDVGIAEARQTYNYTLTFTSGNTEPYKLDKSLIVNKLVANGSLRRMESAGSREKVLQMIHSQIPFEKDRFQLNLSKAIQENDAMAKAWKALLLYEGQYGFSKNREEAQIVAQGVYQKVLNKVSEGNLEAAYLLAKLLNFGLDCNAMKLQSRILLAFVTEKGYPLGQFDMGLLFIAEGNGQAGVKMLQRAADQNFPRATTVLGEIYEYGIGVSIDEAVAFGLYKKAAERMDPAAMYHLGKMYLEGKGVRPDVDLAINWFTKAAEGGESRAMISIGSIYLENIYGKPKDLEKGLMWYEKAAENGSSEGMFRLSVLYLSGDLGYQDINQVKYWVQKAAIEGHGKAAHLLSLFYLHPEVDPKDRDEVLGRFWQMEAKIAGVNVGSTGGEYNPLQEFLQHYNVYETTTVYEDYYGNTYSSTGIDPFSGILEGLAIMSFKSMMPSGDNLNDAKFVYAKSQEKIYAASLNDKTETPIQLIEGQRFRIEGRGNIVFGSFAGSVNANGTTDPLFTKYNRIIDYPHGALMMKIGEDSSWQFVGKDKTFLAPRDGILYLAVNDRDSYNNKNYFDVKVTVSNN